MTGRLEGKVAFITGAARGQGRSHALRFAEEGADIIAVDLCEQIDTVDYPMSTVADLNETVSLVEKLDRRIIAGKADVRNPESMKAVLDKGVADLGRLDFVLANAGVMPTYGDHANEMQAWQDCLDVLLTGVLNTVELTYPLLIKGGNGGSIAITSSMAALQPMMRTEQAKTLGSLGYSAAKSALVNLARNYASFLGPHRIRVNTVHPTGVHTPMVHNAMIDDYFANAHPEDLLTLVPAIPVDMVDPEDISNVMLWLCSDESRYFTGNMVRLDAGASLR